MVQCAASTVNSSYSYLKEAASVTCFFFLKCAASISQSKETFMISMFKKKAYTK